MKRDWLPLALGISGLLLGACGAETTEKSRSGTDPILSSSEIPHGDFDGTSSGAGVEDATSGLPSVDKLEGEEGRWRRFRTHRQDPDLTEAQREQLKALEAIGYMDGSQASELTAGVRTREPGKVQPGLNLYTSGHDAQAILMDSQGRALHTWHADFWEIWPDYPVESDHRMSQFWRRVSLLPDGGLLAIYEGLGLVCLNADSSVRWASPNRAHHDLDVAGDGTIYVLTREAHVVPRVHPTEPILEDFVSVIDPSTGSELRRVSILEAVEASDQALLKEGSRGRSGDLYHTNTLRILDAQGTLPAFSKGRVLIYLLGLGSIGVLDLQSEELVWASTGPETHRHDPGLLDSGRILLFNNFLSSPESSVTEFDPQTGEVLWRYAGSEAEPFYSKTCGTAQRLENGNTLITESDNGRAFEVDRQGQIVWEFVSPHRAGPDDSYIATLFELIRLPESEVRSWLDPAASKASAD